MKYLIFFCLTLMVVACGKDVDEKFEICDNQLDDDGDGLIDCADGDCLGQTNCDNFTIDEFEGRYVGSHGFSLGIIDLNSFLPTFKDTLIITSSDVNGDSIDVTSVLLKATFRGKIDKENGTISFKPLEVDRIDIQVENPDPDNPLFLENIVAAGIPSGTKLNEDKTVLETQIKVSGKAHGLNTLSPIFQSPFLITNNQNAQIKGEFLKE